MYELLFRIVSEAGIVLLMGAILNSFNARFIVAIASWRVLCTLCMSY